MQFFTPKTTYGKVGLYCSFLPSHRVILKKYPLPSYPYIPLSLSPFLREFCDVPVQRSGLRQSGIEIRTNTITPKKNRHDHVWRTQNMGILTSVFEKQKPEDLPFLNENPDVRKVIHTDIASEITVTPVHTKTGMRYSVHLHGQDVYSVTFLHVTVNGKHTIITDFTGEICDYHNGVRFVVFEQLKDIYVESPMRTASLFIEGIRQG